MLYNSYSQLMKGFDFNIQILPKIAKNDKTINKITSNIPL